MRAEAKKKASLSLRGIRSWHGLEIQRPKTLGDGPEAAQGWVEGVPGFKEKEKLQKMLDWRGEAAPLIFFKKTRTKKWCMW